MVGGEKKDGSEANAAKESFGKSRICDDQQIVARVRISSVSHSAMGITTLDLHLGSCRLIQGDTCYNCKGWDDEKVASASTHHNNTDCLWEGYHTQN